MSSLFERLFGAPWREGIEKSHDREFGRKMFSAPGKDPTRLEGMSHPLPWLANQPPTEVASPASSAPQPSPEPDHPLPPPRPSFAGMTPQKPLHPWVLENRKTIDRLVSQQPSPSPSPSEAGMSIQPPVADAPMPPPRPSMAGMTPQPAAPTPPPRPSFNGLTPQSAAPLPPPRPADVTSTGSIGAGGENAPLPPPRPEGIGQNAFDPFAPNYRTGGGESAFVDPMAFGPKGDGVMAPSGAGEPGDGIKPFVNSGAMAAFQQPMGMNPLGALLGLFGGGFA